ncbi:hypothetical protein ABIB10_000368 [Bradyrhizobium sp. RT3b]
MQATGDERVRWTYEPVGNNLSRKHVINDPAPYGWLSNIRRIRESGPERGIWNPIKGGGLKRRSSGSFHTYQQKIVKGLI